MKKEETHRDGGKSLIDAIQDKIRGEKTPVKLQSGVFPIFVDDNKKLRDEFAMRAMHGIVTAFYSQETHHGWKHKEIAEEAYKLADAMLEQREYVNPVQKDNNKMSNE